MPLLRISKRSSTNIDTVNDWNISVFSYFVDGEEVKTDRMKSRVITPFLECLNSLISNDSSNFNIFGNWQFLEPEISGNGAGGSTTIVNNYDGIKYLWRAEVQTLNTPLIPAKLNGFTGRTFKGVFNMMMGRWDFTETSNLDEVAYAEFIDPGYPPEIVDIEVVGGEPRVLATYNVTPSGYYPVQMGEAGTHGKDGFAFRPLSFWDESIVSPGTAEYKGQLCEQGSGFKIETSKILMNLTEQGDALERYNPIDLITFIELIKLQYQYRLDVTVEGQI